MAEPDDLRWSAEFVAVPASASLRGDKITLPPSALEQLLAAAPTAQTPIVSTAFDPRNPYSVAAARRERSLYSETSQQLPNPLMFRLVNPANRNEVYAGIREFSAPDDHMSLGSYLADALGLPGGSLSGSGSDELPRVEVHARQLPKGTYARLRPLEAGYDPDDWRPLLERELRDNHTTLTRDAILTVRGARGESFRFLVDKLLPEGPGVCVVDTDLEVDIEALDEEQARETMRQIMSKARTAPGTEGGSSRGGEIDVWKPVEGQVLPGEYVDYELPSWDRSRGLAIEVTGAGVDLFASPRSRLHRAPPRDDEHVLGSFAPAEVIMIQPTNVALEGAEKLLISVHADSGDGPQRFSLRARVVDPNATLANGTSEGTSVEATTAAANPDETQCKNCLQWVPRRTLVLHENYCLRNNILCPQCRAVFKKSSDEWRDHWHCPHDDAHGSSPAAHERHDRIYHTERQCPSCGVVAASLPELALHRTSVCPGKLILCRFCHLEVPQEGDPLNPSAETILSGLTAHEVADGARTTDCHLCGKIVRLRDMAAHTKHHELDKAARPAPHQCRNAECGRTRDGAGPRGGVGAGPGNDLGLCSICFAPLYVSMHDPEGKALRRRIERRYLGQLMTGCGKRWCANEWCRTGRANAGLEPRGSSAQAALPLVKTLMAGAAAPMHFCVDESSHRWRRLAEALAGEGAWDLAWCVAACEAEAGNLDRAREWLASWAPTRVTRAGRHGVD